MQKRIKNLLERNRYLIAILLTICITILSLSKPISFKSLITISFSDKILHVIAYFSLTLSWLFAFKNNTKNKLIIMALFLYGVLIEFLQGSLTKNREQDVYDIIANSFGMILAMLLFSTFYKYYLKIFDK